jgi:Zn-dependent peptidase ImmA (M78 family)
MSDLATSFAADIAEPTPCEHHQPSPEALGAQQAREVLEDHWSIDRLASDPARMAIWMGLDVFDAGLPPSISGVLLKRRGRHARIVVNRRDPLVRKRVTCAYELGHFVRDPNAKELKRADCRNLLSPDALDVEARFASAFACELLMPRAAVESLAGEGSSDIRQAATFGVPLMAMRERLEALGLGA